MLRIRLAMRGHAMEIQEQKAIFIPNCFILLTLHYNVVVSWAGWRSEIYIQIQVRKLQKGTRSAEVKGPVPSQPKSTN
jgi:hypothetical protein